MFARQTIGCCKDCSIRTVGCHSTCVEYKKEKEELEEWKREKNRKRDSANMAKDVQIRSIKNMKTKHGAVPHK